MDRIVMKTCSWLIPLALIACTDSNPESLTHRFRIYEEKGVSIAETSGGPKYKGEIFTYTHVVTIQQDTSDTQSLLYRPNYRYVMDEGGRFYVADVGNHRIAVFDEQGRFLRSFGRRGDGPGEFRTNFRILSLKNDVISIWDINQRRTTLFNTTGELVNTYSLPNIPHNRKYELHCFDEETLLVLTRMYRENNPRSGWRGWRATTLTPAGDTLAVIDTPIVETSNRFINEGIGMPVGVSIYYAARACILPLPNVGILSTTGEEPEVHIFNPDGSLRSIIRIDIPVESVSAQDRQHIETLYQKRVQEAETERQRAAQKSYLDNVRFAQTRVFWNDIQTDGCGHIWLLYPTYNILLEETGFVFRVLSPEGEYLGDTTWPIPNGSLSRGYLLTLRADVETGELLLEIYKISSAQRGFRYP